LKRTKEAWGLKKKHISLIINGNVSAFTPQTWSIIRHIRVVTKGPGGAEVVIQGPGGWEIELDVETAQEWLWHCGVRYSEILGWENHRLTGAERITLLSNPREGYRCRKSLTNHRKFLPQDSREALREYDRRHMGLVTVDFIDPDENLESVRIDTAWKRAYCCGG
jgi:hypothetical protein